MELGYFAAEGLDAEFVLPPRDASAALRGGEIDLYGASPYVGLMAFPDWKGGKLLCALSQGAYWVLALKRDLHAARGNVQAVKGKRILAGGGPAIALQQVLRAAGVDPERDGVQVVAPPWPPEPGANQARLGARAISEGIADGFWGNSLRAAWASRQGLADVLLDLRAGDGPPAAHRFTFPALVASERLTAQEPAAAAAVRAVVQAQRALRADPSLARNAAQRLFPPEESELIVELVARDSQFYDARITEDACAGAAAMAQAAGLISVTPPYDELVPSELAAAW